jgi:hypothetical protein
MHIIDLNSVLLTVLTKNNNKCTFDDIFKFKNYINTTFTTITAIFDKQDIENHIKQYSVLFEQHENEIKLLPQKNEEFNWLFI